MKIYTKSGDGGETGFLGKGKVSKAHSRIESYGTVDELNSIIGLCQIYVNDENKKMLSEIQNLLFEIGTELASEEILQRLNERHVTDLEKRIDEMEEKLTPLKSFILPGGSESASWVHLARTVTRRAERRIVEFSKLQDLNPIIIKYMNRLSDYFFVLSRYENSLNSIQDREWNSSQ